MDNNYRDIVGQHLKNSYFAELFYSLQQYYQTNPLHPYKETECLTNDYKLLKKYSSYLNHYWNSVRGLFAILIRILMSVISLCAWVLGSIFEFLADAGCTVICVVGFGILAIFTIGSIISFIGAYWDALCNTIHLFSQIIQYWDKVSFNDVVELLHFPKNVGYITVALFPLIVILLVLIIALFTSLFSYHRDKKMVAEYNADIKLQNQKIYEKSLDDCFYYHFKHHIALDSQNYIHNVMKQIDNNYQLFLKRALQNESHSSFEDQCLKFVSSYFKYDINQSSVCVLLFSRIYQILSENEVSSFDEVEKIYNLYEEKGIFQSIKSVLYQRKYYPEYYPVIEYRILMEREFIISSIDNQKGFVENPSNLVLNKYKLLASE